MNLFCHSALWPGMGTRTWPTKIGFASSLKCPAKLKTSLHWSSKMPLPTFRQSLVLCHSIHQLGGHLKGGGVYELNEWNRLALLCKTGCVSLKNISVTVCQRCCSYPATVTACASAVSLVQYIADTLIRYSNVQWLF